MRREQAAQARDVPQQEASSRGSRCAMAAAIAIEVADLDRQDVTDVVNGRQREGKARRLRLALGMRDKAIQSGTWFGSCHGRST
ncbi:hypothetical protein NLS1_30990 [Nocardioides sp. LS1]|nr:hypothetical protein NLS1_30990 [Nocardioides sp. LS1]